MKNMVIGIVGGMGSYATVDFFKRIVDSFPAEKEWDRPRIIVDNYCTMPSRVRAILYDEKKNRLIEELSKSVQQLINSGANRIIFACNTSHYFVPDVIKKVPELNNYIINLISECAKKMSYDEVDEAFLMATEGTIETKIYSSELKAYRISSEEPGKEQYVKMRYFIEAVKQNRISKEVVKEFFDYIESVDNKYIILGCTELPVIYSKYMEKGFIFTKKIYDPLEIVINNLNKEYKEL